MSVQRFGGFVFYRNNFWILSEANSFTLMDFFTFFFLETIFGTLNFVQEFHPATL